MHILKIILEDGRAVYVQPSDLFDVFDFVKSPKEGSRVWERISGAEVLRRSRLKHVKLYLRMHADTTCKEQDYLIHPYVLGALLGDGSFSERGTTIAKPYPEFIHRVKEYLPDGYGLNQITDLIYSLVRVDPDVAPFHKLLNLLGLKGSKSDSKFVPSSYLYGSASQRLELLRGLLDADGTCSQDKVVGFFSSSSSLALGVRYLVWSLGGIAKISQAARTSKVFDGVVTPILPEYRVSIKFPTPWELFTIPHKLAPLLEPSRFSANPKIKISTVEELPVDIDFNYSNSPFIKCW